MAEEDEDGDDGGVDDLGGGGWPKSGRKIDDGVGIFREGRE
ncbi:hypothetical protein Tco_1060436, partial [Tanacetum coccineum]